MLQHHRWVWGGVLAMVLASCSQPSAADDDAADASLLSAIAAYRESLAFVAVNGAPYRSALPDPPMIDVRVSRQAYAEYASITPERAGAGVSIPEGTVIVRAVFDAGGAVARLTAMARREAGYNPDLGDWWFAVTSPDGTPLVDDAGAAKVGRLEECYGCHLGRADDEFLFGVPAANRPPTDDPTVPPPPPPEPPPAPPPPPGPVCGDFLCEPPEVKDTCHIDCDDDGVGDDHGGGDD